MDINNSFSQNYPIDDVLKKRAKIGDLSAYLFYSNDNVDYTPSINRLHKQLLTKIILNRWLMIIITNLNIVQ